MIIILIDLKVHPKAMALVHFLSSRWIWDLHIIELKKGSVPNIIFK
jgi:hypothetical protein